MRRCGNVFVTPPHQPYETFINTTVFILLSSFFSILFLIVGYRSCDGTCNCILKYIFFIFHFSQLSLTPFVQNSFSSVSLFFFFFGGDGGGRGGWGFGRECIIVKKKSEFQNSTHLLFWRYMYFCNVLKNQYKKANTSINVAIALWLKPTRVFCFIQSARVEPAASQREFRDKDLSQGEPELSLYLAGDTVELAQLRIFSATATMLTSR